MKELRDLISMGRQYFDGRDYRKAEELLKSVIERGANYADVFNMLGVIAHVEGKFSSAINHFKDALRINPRYTEAVLNLAVLYNDLGQYAEAKKLYGSLKHGKDKTFGQIEPVLRGKLSNLHADIGDIYRSIGLHRFAIDEYSKALGLNPDYVDIRTKLGQSLREDGKFKRSLAELAKVLRKNPSYSPAFIQQGITHYTMRNTKAAVRSWKAALEKDKGNKYAEMYLKLCEATRQCEETVKGRRKAKPSRGAKRGKR